MSEQPQPLVAVLMGSKSDWDVMRHCAETLGRYGVEKELTLVVADAYLKKVESCIKNQNLTN